MRGAWRLAVDPTKCAGRGLCAEILPELVQLDDWGFPILGDAPVPGRLLRMGRRAVAACPELALFLEPASDPARAAGARATTGRTNPTSPPPVHERHRKEPPAGP